MSEENLSYGPVIVIGAGPGLGMAVARAFATEGYRLALLGRDRERAQGMAAQLESGGHVAKGYGTDAGDPGDLCATIGRAIDELGAPDVLVYNAAVMRGDRPTELSAEEWSGRLAVNVTGATVAAATVIPRLRGGRGTLLFTGGGFGLHPSPDFTAMSVGKAALRAYVLALFEDQRANHVHAATVTIVGNIGEQGFEPGSIARRYVELHHQRHDEWTAEIVVE
jgi:NADP-dependent 3-hydroxy acid dehydrogenase YdfG